jgi:hypothetical protein
MDYFLNKSMVNYWHTLTSSMWQFYFYCFHSSYFNMSIKVFSLYSSYLSKNMCKNTYGEWSIFCSTCDLNIWKIHMTIWALKLINSHIISSMCGMIYRRIGKRQDGVNNKVLNWWCGHTNRSHNKCCSSVKLCINNASL